MQEYLDEFEYTYITENDMFELDEAAYTRVKGLSSKDALTVEEQFEEVEGIIKELSITTRRGREIKAPRLILLWLKGIISTSMFAFWNILWLLKWKSSVVKVLYTSLALKKN